MEYVELMRARRVLTWYGGILFVLVALGLALVFKDGPPHLRMSHDANPRIPFQYIIGGAAFAPLLLAAFLAVCFDAEYKTAAIAWTRPLPRLAIAARYLAVDFGTLIGVWLLTVAAALICIVVLGLAPYLTFDANANDFIVRAFGAAVMWYGLVVLVTVLLPGRANAIAGASWAYVLIIPGIARIDQFPPAIHQAFVALDYLNPLAYMGQFGTSASLLAGSTTAHTIASWAIGLAAVAIGTQLWAKREVPA